MIDSGLFYFLFMRVSNYLNPLNLIVLLILMGVSIGTGVADFSWSQLLYGQESMQLLLVSRLPRTLAIVLSGAALTVAGMVLQIVLKNRFIEPSMIGATQSAALGILLISLLYPAVPPLGKMGAATLSALIGIAIFVAILRRLPPHQQLLIPLVGIIFGNVIEAASQFIALETDSMQLLTSWLVGDFSSVLAGRYELLWLTGAMALIAYILADRLTIAGLGREMSTSLGVNHTQMLWIALIVVALIISVVVVTVGQITFIGLVVPNIVSRLAGDRLRKNLPSVALLGANALLFCDILARRINNPYEIPVSIIFGVIGALIFLYLLYRKPPSYAS